LGRLHHLCPVKWRDPAASRAPAGSEVLQAGDGAMCSVSLCCGSTALAEEIESAASESRALAEEIASAANSGAVAERPLSTMWGPCARPSAMILIDLLAA